MTLIGGFSRIFSQKSVRIQSIRANPCPFFENNDIL
jgi:hypothetical protein